MIRDLDLDLELELELGSRMGNQEFVVGFLY